MPYIVTKTKTLLAPLPDPVQTQPTDLLSIVPKGAAIGVTKVTAINPELAEIVMAGPYTWHEAYPTIETGAIRYINPLRWTIPSDAWVLPAVTPTPSRIVTPPVMPSSGGVPKEAFELIKLYEGCHRKLPNGMIEAYPDPATGGEPWTIGWGNTRYADGSKVKPGDQITQQQADELCLAIVRQEFLPPLTRIPNWEQMSDKQKGAILSFAYNLGANFYGTSGFETITAKLQSKNWNEIDNALILYRNPRSNVEVGLGRRRRAEGLVWFGAETDAAFRQAERDINSPADCERFEQAPATGDHAPPSESVRDKYNPNKPVNWKDPNCRVSKYFLVKEVTQNDPRRIPKSGSEDEKDILDLARKLDHLREAWGVPIGVTSWFRPEPVNAQVGGVSGSQHTFGRAVDIYTMDSDGFSQRDREFEDWLDTVAWKDMALGYGVRSGRGFTHLDSRPGKIRWTY